MMLTHYLDRALEDLETLIHLTETDIEDIKQARHDALFDRIRSKEHALVTFENRKSLIDNEIAARVGRQPNAPMETLLNEEEREKLATLREKLEALQDANRRFARLVIAVGEFYNSLYEKVLPVEKDDYKGSAKAKSAAFLEVRA
jgi:hypothetical protein